MPDWLWHPFLVVAIGWLGIGGVYQGLTGRSAGIGRSNQPPLLTKVLGWFAALVALFVLVAWLSTS